MELPRKIEVIGYASFSDCALLRNISAPCTLHGHGSRKVEKQFPNHIYFWDATKKRYDGLAIHIICYLQAYYPAKKTVLELSRSLKTTPNSNSTDCFGLSPLHVLALSTKVDQQVWIALMQRYNVDMAHKKDNWGFSPLYYLCANSVMNATKVLRYVVNASIEYMMGTSGFRKWKLELLAMSEIFSEDMDMLAKIEYMNQIYGKLACFVRQEQIALLEQGLWKARIQELPDVHRMSFEGRWACRITSGVEVVASSVLPFLGKPRPLSW